MEIKKSFFLPTSRRRAGGTAACCGSRKSYKAKLFLLHVIYDMSMSTGLNIPHVSFDALYDEMEKGARKELENFGGELRDGLNDVECSVVRGCPL